jgi:hypothetical protein
LLREFVCPAFYVECHNKEVRSKYSLRRLNLLSNY